jgi:hypothetical protein
MKGNCDICGNEIELQICCSQPNLDCGCNGLPIGPPVCSNECEEKYRERMRDMKGITEGILVDPETQVDDKTAKEIRDSWNKMGIVVFPPDNRFLKLKKLFAEFDSYVDYTSTNEKDLNRLRDEICKLLNVKKYDDGSGYDLESELKED